MWAVAFSGIRYRVASSLAVFVATALGAALVMTAGGFLETGIRLTAPADRLSAAQMIVIGSPDYVMLTPEGERSTDYRPYPERHRLEPSDSARIEQVPGVERAVPVFFLDAVVQVGDSIVPVTVQNASSAAVGPFRVREGRMPSGQGIALSGSLAEELSVGVGESLTLTLGGEAVEREVAGIAGSAEAPPTVFVSDGAAMAAAGSERADAIAVVPTAAADAGEVRDGIHAALADIVVLEGGGRGAAENPAVSASRVPAIVTGAVFGGIVLVVLGTIVSGVVSLSVRQRAREISLLRATGATGRQARRVLVIEAMATGLAGTCIGVLLGLPIAATLFAVVSAVGLFPPVLRLEVGVIPMAVAVVAPLAVLFLAVSAATRGARRSRAIDALREADLPPLRTGATRWILGVLFGLGAIALAIITCLMPPSLVTATSGPAVLAGSISAALLAPVWARTGNALLRPLTRAFWAPVGGVASQSIRARSGQLSTVTACIALVVGIGMGNLASHEVQRDAAVAAAVAPFRADAVLDVEGRPADVAGRAASLGAVGAAGAVVFSGGWIEQPHDPSHPDRPWSVVGIDTPEVLDLAVDDGDLAELRGESIALPRRNAEELGLTVGDDVFFRFGDGEAGRLRLVATYADRAGYERILLPADLLAGHTTARQASTILVRAASGVSENDLQDALRAEFDGDGGVAVSSGRSLVDVAGGGLSVQTVINSLMVAIAIAYSAIAIVNTLAVTILARRRELALLRLTGATRRQTTRVLAAETSVLAITGTVMGMFVAVAAIVPTAFAVGGSVLNARAAALFLGTIVVVTALVFPVTWIIGRRATSGRAVDEVGEAA